MHVVLLLLLFALIDSGVVDCETLLDDIKCSNKISSSKKLAFV